MIILVFIVLTLCSSLSQAKDVYFGRGEVQVTVPFYDDNGDMVSEPTVFVFHKEVYSITDKNRFIISPENRENPDHRRLTVIPMVRSGRQIVSFTLSNQSTLRVAINIVKKKRVEDPEVRFLPRSSFKKKSALRTKMTDLDFIRALRSGAEIMGAERSKTSQSLRCGSWNIKARLIQTDVGADTKGYTIEFKNKSNKYEYEFDDTKIYFSDQDLGRSIITHLTSPVLEQKKKKGSRGVMRIVTDGGTSLRNGHICKIGEQLIKRKVQEPKVISKSKPKRKSKKSKKRGKS